MRVLFVGSHREDRQFSIYGFEQALQRELKSKCDFDVVFPGMGYSGLERSKWTRYLEKYVLFPALLRKRARGASIVHFCEPGAALNVRHVRSKTTLVTMHDFLAVQASLGQFPGWDVSWSGKVYQRLILRSAREASALACVSETTRAAKKIYLQGYQGQVRTILNGLYRLYHELSPPEALARLPHARQPAFERFFFHIGGNKPYKNRSGVLEIYAKVREMRPALDWGLVMAGGGKSAALSALESRLGLGPHVQWYLEPNDDEVEALYSLAEALIFPSLAEGFGLPVLEAQSCRCPVFASSRGPMTEVGGRSAVYFEPTDPLEAATQIVSHLDNLPELRQLGDENVKRFDTRIMAQGYLDYYRDLAG